MAAIAIKDIVSQAQDFATQAVAGAAQKKEEFARAQAALGEQSKILNVVAQDMATMKATDQAAELKAQSARAEYAAATKMDGQGMANSMIAMGVAQMEQNKALAGTLKTITEKESVQFTDNPFAWLGAQVTVKKDMEVARAQLAQVQQTHSAIQQTAQGFSSFAVTQDLQKQNVTQASAAAATRIAASSALISAQQTEIESVKYNVEAVNATLGASNAELTAAAKIYEAQSNQEGQKMQQLAFNATAQQRAFEQELRADAQEARRIGKEMDARTMEFLNLSMTQAGLPPVSAEDAPVFLARFKSGDPELVANWRNGRIISQQPVSKTRMGGTIAESAEFLSKFPTNLEGLRKDTAALIMGATERIPRDKRTPKEKADWLNENVQVEVNQAYSNITKGSLFDAGEVSQYFGIQSIAQLPLVSKVLEPLRVAGTKLDDPEAVMNLGMAAMKAGTITSSEFSSGIEQLYRKASRTNMDFRDFQGFGIQIPEGGNTYNVKINRWGKAVNLLDPVQVNRWVVEKAFEVKKNESLINSTAPVGMRNFPPR